MMPGPCSAAGLGAAVGGTVVGGRGVAGTIDVGEGGAGVSVGSVIVVISVAGVIVDSASVAGGRVSVIMDGDSVEIIVVSTLLATDDNAMVGGCVAKSVAPGAVGTPAVAHPPISVPANTSPPMSEPTRAQSAVLRLTMGNIVKTLLAHCPKGHISPPIRVGLHPVVFPTGVVGAQLQPRARTRHRLVILHPTRQMSALHPASIRDGARSRR